jgi:hypothetical protein
MAALAESDIISAILTMITDEDIIVPKLSDELGTLIRSSEYALS